MLYNALMLYSVVYDFPVDDKNYLLLKKLGLLLVSLGNLLCALWVRRRFIPILLEYILVFVNVDTC